MKSIDTESKPLPSTNFMGIHGWVSLEIQVLWYKVKTLTREAKMNELYFALETVF